MHLSEKSAARAVAMSGKAVYTPAIATPTEGADMDFFMTTDIHRPGHGRTA